MTSPALFGLESWNEVGRATHEAGSAALTAFHLGQTDQVDLPKDPRTAEQAEAVLAEVMAANASRRWRDARAKFDPAHAPFLARIEKHCRTLPCAIILGPDSFLVRLGAAYQEGPLLHLDGDRVTPLDGLTAAAISPDRAALLLVADAGFTVHAGSLGGAIIAEFGWPVAPCRLDQVRVANGGQRIAFADDEAGVWVGTHVGGDTIWSRAHPDENAMTALRRDLEDPDAQWNDSMTHCALSADGTWLACGSQCSDHLLSAIGDDGTVAPWATAAPYSEYPHDACFDAAGRLVTFNACHFYSGATAIVSIDGIERGAYIEAEPPHSREINPYLRVYASTWLPPGVAGSESGLFALAGSGILTAVSSDGIVAFEQMIGSSASAIDYDPVSRRMILSAYSGFLHVFDTDAAELPGRAMGFNARRELYRWVLWQDIDPFRW